MHHMILKEKRILPDDGLILGNGDISVSVYCDIGQIQFRLGKGDVWDCRQTYTADPAPVAAEEFARGLETEGWKCGPYGGEVFATKAPAKDPERMSQICQGSPPSYRNFPYPCPKPVGEFVMYLAQDIGDPVFDFDLCLEEATLSVNATFANGFSVSASICVDPENNLLLVDWKTEGFEGRTYPGCRETRILFPPVRFALFREADQHLDEYRTKLYFSSDAASWFYQNSDPMLTQPLAKPVTGTMPGCNYPYIMQRFQPELTYPTGFECAMTVFGPAERKLVDYPGSSTKGMVIYPENPFSGKLCVGIETTGLDGTKALTQLRRLLDVTADIDSCAQQLRDRLKDSCEAFWSVSSLETEETVFERGWYETLYLQHCIYRSGKQSPALFMPSTVQDASHWHGDYHTNYNIQEPFWGMPESNHPELMKPYIELMVNWFLPMGKMIAEKYYHCRGCYIQLTGYPMLVADDPLGILPMGRMAYMTGWVPNQVWLYYRSTMDLEFLKKTGYPFMRECALFYHDFLKLGEDGLYHAFPSNQGEDGFTGNAEPYRDAPQVITHIRQCLYFAIQAGKIADPNDPLLPGLAERFEKLAPPRGTQWPQLEGLALHRWESSVPEFGKILTPYNGGGYQDTEEILPEKVKALFDVWYFGHCLDMSRGAIRSGNADADSIYCFLRKIMTDWHKCNGTYTGMARTIYGQCGAFTESLGINGPITDMLLLSFDGAIAVFPRWPLNKQMRFRNLRAEGAFLVSAACGNGAVSEVCIYSEKGGLCAMYMPETMTVTCDGRTVPVIHDAFGRPAFQTEPGKEYCVAG